MKERNITITIDKARELFNSGNKQLQEIALQAFDKTELLMLNFIILKHFKMLVKLLSLITVLCLALSIL